MSLKMDMVFGSDRVRCSDHFCMIRNMISDCEYLDSPGILTEVEYDVAIMSTW